MTSPTDWLPLNRGWDRGPYPAPLKNVSPPSPGCPVHWLSPAGAVKFAKLLKCRLPTRAEWRAAWGKELDATRPGNQRRNSSFTARGDEAGRSRLPLFRKTQPHVTQIAKCFFVTGPRRHTVMDQVDEDVVA